MEMRDIRHHMKVTLEGDRTTYTVQATHTERHEVFITARFGNDTVGRWYAVHLLTEKTNMTKALAEAQAIARKAANAEIKKAIAEDRAAGSEDY
jgi:nucleoside-triphosphatase THEP1